MRNIKNIEKLTKEALIITLLKSESSVAECNFEKLLNDNNNNNNNNIDNGTYDDKIRDKTHNISIMLN